MVCYAGTSAYRNLLLIHYDNILLVVTSNKCTINKRSVYLLILLDSTIICMGRIQGITFVRLYCCKSKSVNHGHHIYKESLEPCGGQNSLMEASCMMNLQLVLTACLPTALKINSWSLAHRTVIPIV